VCGGGGLPGGRRLRGARPVCIRWIMGPHLCHGKRHLRCDLQFCCQHHRRDSHPSESGQVQRAGCAFRRGSRIGDGARQIRRRLGSALEQFRPWHVEWPFREFALLGLLDCPAKLGLGQPLMANVVVHRQAHSRRFAEIWTASLVPTFLVVYQFASRRQQLRKCLAHGAPSPSPWFARGRFFPSRGPAAPFRA
jgi:hypothetical protein